MKKPDYLRKWKVNKNPPLSGDLAVLLSRRANIVKN